MAFCYICCITIDSIFWGFFLVFLLLSLFIVVIVIVVKSYVSLLPFMIHTLDFLQEYQRIMLDIANFYSAGRTNISLLSASFFISSIRSLLPNHPFIIQFLFNL